MTRASEDNHLSVLHPESRGGDIAQGGFLFQEQVVLAHIPRWLSRDGFTAMTQESIGDAEAKFFVPGRGFHIEALEVKDHSVTPSEFWGEVQRFQDMDAGSPGTYAQFTISCAGLSPGLKPLVNGLRRMRDAYGFYDEGDAVIDGSFDDLLQIVENIGRDEQDVRFLLERVTLEADWSTARSHGEAVFRQSLISNLPEYQDLPIRTLAAIYEALGAYVRKRRNQPLSRRELEGKLRERIPPEQRPRLRPISIHTKAQNVDHPSPTALHFSWMAFFGGPTRSFPPPDAWDKRLMGELQETRNWIVQHRAVRTIKVKGTRRLSASLAIGSVFSAVSGFSLELEHRGEIWSTTAHPTATTPAYPLVVGTANGDGTHLVVTVSILKDIVPEVKSSLKALGLSGAPRLHIKGENAIESPEHANAAVRAMKSSISRAVAQTGSERLDLFLAGPAFLALFLGHRLNAMGSIQCYEWTSAGHYVPTCLLCVSS